MFPLQSETENVAVATAPLPTPAPRPRFQPIAGLSSDSPISSAPVTPEIKPQVRAQTETPPSNMRATVFAGENRPQSPWAGVPQTVVAKQPAAAYSLGSPAPLPEAEDGIEGVRKLLVGRQMTEMHTKVAELQLALNGEFKRLRESLMGRVDEMAAYLHRDMVVLRDEMHREMAQLKADLFTAATGLSSVKDRLMALEVRPREDTASALAEMDARIVRQESAFGAALDHVESRLETVMESKCAEALAVLVKKSEMADLLSQVGILVEKQEASVDLGWPSVPSASNSPSTPPLATSREDSLPLSSAPERSAWETLAKSTFQDGTVSDWTQPAGFPPSHDSLIA